MAWIKRNLFFVLGGVISLAMLGAAGYYIYAGWSSNSASFDSLNEVVGNYRNLIDQKPSPGNDRIDNTEIARDQDKQLRDWINSTAAFFQPIASIPPAGTVTGASFSSALQKTLDQLQHEADAAGVLLPPKFYFSFSAENDRMTFAPAGLEPLAAQLGEVKALSEIVFASRVNALDGIQRVAVSDDDGGGTSTDYVPETPVTNDLAVITPYILTFRCFTPELARVMIGLATAPNTYIVKSVSVQPAGAASLPVAPSPMMGDQPPRMMGEGYTPPNYVPPGYGQPANMQPAPPKGGLQTVLKEQLLRVVIEVELVKLLPKN